MWVTQALLSLVQRRLRGGQGCSGAPQRPGRKGLLQMVLPGPLLQQPRAHASHRHRDSPCPLDWASGRLPRAPTIPQISTCCILKIKTERQTMEGQTAAQTAGVEDPAPWAPPLPALTFSLLRLGEGLLPPPLCNLPHWENACKSSQRSHAFSFCLMRKAKPHCKKL